MITIFANPTAGSGLTKQNLFIVEEYLKNKNIEFVTLLSSYKGEITELVENNAKEGDRLIVIGGDGTFNEFINGLSQPEKFDICFIPGGTGNDFSYALNNNDPIKILEKFLNNESKKVDYLSVNNFKCLNVCGVGLDADVLKRYEALPKKTKMGYAKCLVKVLCNFNFYKLKLKIDDEKEIEGEFMLIAASNGKRFGANIYISPNSVVDDGFIHLILIKKLKKFIIPFAFLGFIKGKHLKKSYAEEILCKKVEITNNEPSITYNLDGQLFEGNKVVVEVKEKQINTYVE